MLVRADELQYDNTNNRIIAVGNVQIYYKRSTLEADKVIYEQSTKRMRAEGNARFTEADGKIVHGEIIELTDQFRDGFVDSLQLEAADKTRFAAPRAERSGGRFTTFQSGVYTACEPCKDDPKRPPRWQIRTTRIIHDETEKMIYFEDARARILRLPDVLLAVSFDARPDGEAQDRRAVCRSFGYTSIQGFGLTVPYFWALAPNYDFTLTPTLIVAPGPAAAGRMAPPADERRLCDQGRRHLPGGSERHSSPGAGPDDPGNRLFRGSFDTTGQFSLNNNWVWGWDGTAGDRQDGPAGLRPEVLLRAGGSVQIRRARNRHAALSHRPRRAQLFRCARDVLSTACRRPTFRARFRSSIR